MSPTQKAARKPARRQSAAARSTPAKGGAAEHARFMENERVIRHVTDSLEVAQADLAKLRANLGAGVGDAHKNLSRLLRDARRDAAKLGRATRKDLQRLQKDMLAAAKAAPKRAGVGKPATAAKAASKRAGAKAAPKRPVAKAAPKRADAKAAPKRTAAKAPPKRAASKPRSAGAGRAR
jgi:vacuolar-type H+-ATPase subunit H